MGQAKHNAVDTLIKEISLEVHAFRHQLGWDALSDKVTKALAEVPRDQFVPAGEICFAWDNRPLPIGYQQTISQPFIVAIMTQLLQPESSHRILEIGTGCGYQAAILSRLVKQVYSIEVVPELAEQAQARLQRLGYHNVTVLSGDGYKGWPEEAPFDGIIVTAGSALVPEPLITQLQTGGRMVIPLGETGNNQMLQQISKLEGGKLDVRDILPVVFVPFIRTS